jgi:hypothetical protein
LGELDQRPSDNECCKQRWTRTQSSKNAQAQRNTCVGRLLASSGPTTVSFVLSVTFKERGQGIGVAIVNVNRSCPLFAGILRTLASFFLFSFLEGGRDTGTHKIH